MADRVEQLSAATSPSAPSDQVWLTSAQLRIDVQRRIIAGLAPGAPDHRLATQVLLTFQDCLATMIEAHATIDACRRKKQADRDRETPRR